jgi:hypothetical protein
LRIPNALIFKDILLNKTASTTVRGSFDVVIPWDASIATATEAISAALRGHEGFEEDPPPRTLVEAIEPGGIRLRSYFWYPARGVDRMKLVSDSLLAAKVALQKAGIAPAPGRMIIQVAGGGPLERPLTRARAASRDRSLTVAADKEQANLQNDTEAASIAAAQLPQDQENEIRHVLDIAGKGIDEEGRNLIGDTPGQ